FQRIGEIIRKKKISPENIWNGDQKGAQIGYGTNYCEVVYCHANKRHTSKVVGGKGHWVSIMEVVSAGRRALPGFYIKSDEMTMVGNMRNHLDDERIVATPQTGYINDQLCLIWLKEHFDRHARPSRQGRSRLLILD
ncbi:hypothetical protein EX30DRAFT_299679, partial [Ascodesmis nigricans]